MMTFKELLDTVSARTKKSRRELAARLEITPQNLSKKEVLDSARLCDVLRICDGCGMGVALVDVKKGKRIKIDKSALDVQIRYADALYLLDLVGVDIEFFDADTGKKIEKHIMGYGRRIRQLIEGDYYDTAECDAVSSGLYADGENKYSDDSRELYRAKDGRYILACYTLKPHEDRIIRISDEEAEQFIAEHGSIE